MPKKNATASRGPSQADLFAGEKARDAGLALVAENSGTWFERARACVDTPLFRKLFPSPFPAEDIRVFLEEARVGEPHSHRAWGALVSRLVKDGVIVPTGRMVPSRRTTSHAHRTPEYCAGGKP